QGARRAAEAANRAKDEFLAMVSHELRTPLGTILSWAHLLRSGRLDAGGTTRAIETIDRNARLQAQLINDLLDVSRINAGKLELDVYLLDAADLEPQLRHLPSPPGGPPRADGLHVLIVDDDASTLESLRALFEHYGARVTAVPSATAASRALESVRPDVLVSDIAMPDEDG